IKNSQHKRPSRSFLEVEMSSRARRLGGALLLLALLSLVGAAFASADQGPPAKNDQGKLHKVGISNPSTPQIAPTPFLRLTAKLSPLSSTSSASGRWDGMLVHLVVVNGQVPAITGCSAGGCPTRTCRAPSAARRSASPLRRLRRSPLRRSAATARRASSA